MPPARPYSTGAPARARSARPAASVMSVKPAGGHLLRSQVAPAPGAAVEQIRLVRVELRDTLTEVGRLHVDVERTHDVRLLVLGRRAHVDDGVGAGLDDGHGFGGWDAVVDRGLRGRRRRLRRGLLRLGQRVLAQLELVRQDDGRADGAEEAGDAFFALTTEPDQHHRVLGLLVGARSRAALGGGPATCCPGTRPPRRGRCQAGRRDPISMRVVAMASYSPSPLVGAGTGEEELHAPAAVVDELEGEGFQAGAVGQAIALERRLGQGPQGRQVRSELGQLRTAGAVEREAVADGLELGAELVGRRPGGLLGTSWASASGRQREGQGKGESERADGSVLRGCRVAIVDRQRRLAVSLLTRRGT